MKNSQGEVIYVGKAKNLKNRVSSYFLSKHEKGSKVEKMVENIEKFEYIITDSEFEALILECSLIKKYNPKYNILLKDSKGYSYIKITNEVWPKIFYVKQKINDGCEYIGPYISSFSVKKTVEEILKIFKLPDCIRDLSKISKKPCLNYYINKCSAPCTRKISHENYILLIKEAKDFLKKGINQTILKLKSEMNKASENMQFELAAKIRDRILAIEKIKEKQKVVSSSLKNQDVISFVHNKEKASFHLFRFKDGNLYESNSFIFDFFQTESKMRADFLKMFYQNQIFLPEKINLDGKTEDKILIEKFLSKKAHRKIKIEIPKNGEALKIMQMCKNNAYENLLKSSNMKTKEEFCLEDLKNTLSLKNVAKRIEVYDISNLFGTNCVAGMVVFANGKALKSDYRKFNLGYMQDDFLAMNSVIDRRIKNYKNFSNDDSFKKLPDLILVDGGISQVTAAKKALSENGIDIPVFGMVKDKKHRTRALTSEQNEIKIKNKSRLFAFLTSVQDEVHRYAVNYHRKLRIKETKTSVLTSISNIGTARAKALLKSFKTIENIKNASFEKLFQVQGMNKLAAKSVFEYFHENKT